MCVCVCRCQSICDLSFQLEKDLESRNSEVSKLQQIVSDLQVYVQQEREQVLRLYTENDRLQVYLLPDSTFWYYSVVSHADRTAFTFYAK